MFKPIHKQLHREKEEVCAANLAHRTPSGGGLQNSRRLQGSSTGQIGELVGGRIAAGHGPHLAWARVWTQDLEEEIPFEHQEKKEKRTGDL